MRIDQEADIALAGGLLLFLHHLAIDQLKSLGVTDRPRVPAMTGLIYPPNTPTRATVPRTSEMFQWRAENWLTYTAKKLF